uniref:Uncharacterized protein n=1 Tax=Rhizophora mucronata TaxID=61149 RepID=A0A2P2QJJ0_RHIMU
MENKCGSLSTLRPRVNARHRILPQSHS